MNYELDKEVFEDAKTEIIKRKLIHLMRRIDPTNSMVLKYDEQLKKLNTLLEDS